MDVLDAVHMVELQLDVAALVQGQVIITGNISGCDCRIIPTGTDPQSTSCEITVLDKGVVERLLRSLPRRSGSRVWVCERADIMGRCRKEQDGVTIAQIQYVKVFVVRHSVTATYTIDCSDTETSTTVTTIKIADLLRNRESYENQRCAISGVVFARTTDLVVSCATNENRSENELACLIDSEQAFRAFLRFVPADRDNRTAAHGYVEGTISNDPKLDRVVIRNVSRIHLQRVSHLLDLEF
jgi:hypothetical protein